MIFDICQYMLNIDICLRSPSQPSLSPPSLLCRGANQIIKLTFHCNISFLLFVGYLSILLLVPCTYYYFFWCQYINIYLFDVNIVCLLIWPWKKRLDTSTLRFLKHPGALPSRPVDWYQHHGLLHDQHLPGFPHRHIDQ